MYVQIEDFNNVVDTVKQQAKATESQASLVRNLDELARLQHIRINSAGIVVNIGGLIAFHMVTP